MLINTLNVSEPGFFGFEGLEEIEGGGYKIQVAGPCNLQPVT
jgi:hypothetical protein